MRVASRIECFSMMTSDPATIFAQKNACLQKLLAGTPLHPHRVVAYRSWVGDQRSPPPNVCR
jgi:hypothetical protein